MMSGIKQLFERVAPDTLYAIAASLYWTAHPNKATKIVFPVEECWGVWSPDPVVYTLPADLDERSRFILRGSAELKYIKFSQYTLGEFASVSRGDTVVDIGAFIGEFTIPAAEIGSMVIAIEPDPQTYKCLAKNVANRENVTAHQELISSVQKTVTFNSASDASESSMLAVDKGNYEEVQMTARPLDDVLQDMDVNEVDFLKIDAEGAEPEVVQGLSETRIQKLAIDTGPERNGERTTSTVVELLETKGYEVRVVGSIVFARLESQG